ncbi:MAG: 16S rRNA (guanine(527)-N(7))-methyltransferase RsmG [Bacillota bacterium]
MRELERVLVEETRLLGLAIGPEELDLFRRYYELLVGWAERVNLTAAREEREIAARHLADSLAGLLVLRGKDLRLVDVGSGAGFPGLVLKIMRPSWQVTLLEASRKKCAFLREAAARLGLTGVTVVWGRAEDAGRAPEHRGAFAGAVARGVAELRVLLEYGLPLVARGGLFVAYKGERAAEEVAGAKRALAVLGGEVRELVTYTLGGGRKGTLVVVEKVGETPAAYPRRPGVPARRPL